MTGEGAANGWQTFWGPDTWAGGFVAMPTRLLARARDLGLDAADLALVAHLLSFARPGAEPWPSVVTLAERLGIQRRQAQRRLARLERLGLVQRVARLGRSSSYDLSGLAMTTRALHDHPGHTVPGGGVMGDQGGASPMTHEEEDVSRRRKKITTGGARTRRAPAPPSRRSLKLTPEENRAKQVGVDCLHQRAREFTGLASPPGYSDGAAARFFAERARAGDTEQDFREGIDEFFARLSGQADRARQAGRRITPNGSFAFLRSSWGSILRALVERRREAADAANR